MIREMRVEGDGLAANGHVNATFGPTNTKRGDRIIRDTNTDLGNLPPLGELDRQGADVYNTKFKEDHPRHEELGWRTDVMLSLR